MTNSPDSPPGDPATDEAAAVDDDAVDHDAAEDTTETPPTAGRIERFKEAIAAARGTAETKWHQLEDRRRDNEPIDVTFSTVERDLERGGGLLAGALAYRFFFWMLPFLLVLIGALGFLQSTGDEKPHDLAQSFGAFGFAAKSVSQAAQDGEHLRIWALAIGLPVLYFASISFVKALMVAHSLIWGVPNHKIKKKAYAALAMTAVLVGVMIALAAENSIRSQSQGPGLIAVAGFFAVVGVLWLYVSWNMPRPPGTRTTDLLPGVLLVAAGLQGVHILTVYYVSRKIAHASATYGQLGAAAGILLSLFLIARVIVLGAELNAELWTRKQEKAAQEAQDADPQAMMSSSSVEPQ